MAAVYMTLRAELTCCDHIMISSFTSLIVNTSPFKSSLAIVQHSAAYANSHGCDLTSSGSVSLHTRRVIAFEP